MKRSPYYRTGTRSGTLPPLHQSYDGRYGSSHFSVFDPLGRLNPVDMNLQANIGRPELSPEIGYRAGPDGLLNPRQFNRMESKLRKLHYQKMTREEKEAYKEKRKQKRLERIARGEIVSRSVKYTARCADSDVGDLKLMTFRLQHPSLTSM